jgi:hypothetical protein
MNFEGRRVTFDPAEGPQLTAAQAHRARLLSDATDGACPQWHINA